MTKRIIFLSYLLGKECIGFFYDTAGIFLDKLNSDRLIWKDPLQCFLLGVFSNNCRRHRFDVNFPVSHLTEI